MVKVEINGIEVEAREGSMVIEAADQAGIAIPRFCYHKKLSIAANCRMCLVEVEKAPKPLPACATPVTEGMKVFTDSPKAITAQKGVMEFLLINHPLDCPICDQGGECELQDLAMGYGSDVSRYTEAKRVVKDKNIGPLISTDMTRCIHCTRCVRFGAEIAGVRELGATGRGEHMTIGTYIEQSVSSELSGNVIDLCPVGALTSKPFRFQARAWEMTQHATVAPHDAVGSNLYLHVRGGKVLRAVPRDNEMINECWISDRDRFSYLGLRSDDRLSAPLIRGESGLEAASWEEALQFAAEKLRDITAEAADQLGVLAKPTSTLEELFLLQKLTRAAGSGNIDHRLEQADFRDDSTAPLAPVLGQTLAELEERDAILLIATNVRKEQPLLGHRLRKAALNGAAVSVVNPIDFDFNFTTAEQRIVSPQTMAGELAAIARAVCAKTGGALPADIDGIAGVEVGETHRAIAERLVEGRSTSVLMGQLAAAHPDGATLRGLARFIARESGAVFGQIACASNSAGAALAGAMPHRQPGGQPAASAGLNAAAMLAQPRKGYLLLGVEPELDFADSVTAVKALTDAEVVVALSAYRTPALDQVADVVLPIALFAETAGTFVNGQGDWQTFAGAVLPPGEARPAWKVLRVLANLLKLEGFDYQSADEVLEEARSVIETAAVEIAPGAIPAPTRLNGSRMVRLGDVPLYATDALVRRAGALQQTGDATRAFIGVSPADARDLALEDEAMVTARQNGSEVSLPVRVDTRVAEGTVWLAAGIRETAGLGPAIGPIELVRA